MHLTQERGSKTDTAHTLWLKKNNRTWAKVSNYKVYNGFSWITFNTFLFSIWVRDKACSTMYAKGVRKAKYLWVWKNKNDLVNESTLKGETLEAEGFYSALYTQVFLKKRLLSCFIIFWVFYNPYCSILHHFFIYDRQRSQEAVMLLVSNRHPFRDGIYLLFLFLQV